MLAIAPHLRSLEVRGAAIGLEELRHPTLERVVIQTGGLPGVTAEAIARAQLPAATHLCVYYGSSEYGCEASLADVVVVGARGRRGLARLLLGSVASSVAHHVQVPTVIVPTPADAADDDH